MDYEISKLLFFSFLNLNYFYHDIFNFFPSLSTRNQFYRFDFHLIVTVG